MICRNSRIHNKQVASVWWMEGATTQAEDKGYEGTHILSYAYMDLEGWQGGSKAAMVVKVAAVGLKTVKGGRRGATKELPLFRLTCSLFSLLSQRKRWRTGKFSLFLCSTLSLVS